MHSSPSIIVISPHLDDAALDLCDHIFKWKAQGSIVKIITVFTSFHGMISTEAKKNTGIQSSSVKAFEVRRRSEDKKAMRLLGVRSKHLGFVDGGFRSYNRTLAYHNFRELFSGRVSPLDAKLFEKLKSKIMPFALRERIIIPLGVGRHADHLLVRRAAEAVIPRKKLEYYIDYPYALSFSKWTISQAIMAARMKKSVLPFQPRKEKILSMYASQMPILFPAKMRYPEIVLRF